MGCNLGQVILKNEIYRIQTAGRINLIGEHTDHQLGMVLPIAINAKISIYGSLREDNKIVVYSENYKEKFIFNLEDISSFIPENHHWLNYVVGIVKSFNELHDLSSGCIIAITSDLPQGIGLSSSAALEIGLFILLEQLYNYHIEPIDVVKQCWSVENSFVGVSCGIMDQFIVRFGKVNSVCKLNCANLSYETTSLPNNASLLILDTLIRHTLVDSPYNTRINECSVTLKEIQDLGFKITSLSELKQSEFEKIQGKLNKPLSLRVKHVLSENKRVNKFFSILESSKNNNDSSVLPKLGSLLYESHESLKENFEASWNRADQIVEYVKKLAPLGVYGARMMGGGFGGSILLLVDQTKQVEIIKNLESWFFSTFKEKTTIFQFTSANGTEFNSISKDDVPDSIKYLFH